MQRLIRNVNRATDSHPAGQVDGKRIPAQYPREATIHGLFEEHAIHHPDVAAVVYNGDQLTFGELNARSNQLARYLQGHGVGPEVLVGVLMERSLELIVGLLGILKAGGGYVPLDPAYPPERLAFMLADTQATVLLAHERLLARVPARQAAVVHLDRDWGTIARASCDHVDSVTTAHNAAYVIYTSGSTGGPKGVMVTHRAVIRLVRNTNYVGVSSTDCVGQVSTCSFDAATFEIWGALLNGAQLVGIPREVLLAPQRFATQLRVHRVSVLFVTTALFNQLVRAVPEVFVSVRQLLFGGEAVVPQWVGVALEHGSAQRLLHVYGPTEGTTFTTWHEVSAVPEGATTIPIGRPIANTQVVLLDGDLQPVPVGVPGELYIGGDGLARGYVQRPDLTADKFVPSPFAEEPEQRLYKTGDLAQCRSDGAIEFIGRRDQQVKLRGFRIELGEVEVTLARHRAVRDTAVLVQEDEPGEKRLVAYAVGMEGEQPAQEELRRFLRGQLPEYMVPTAFVFLEALPLTPNGKVDRHALPAPSRARSVLAEPFVAPRTPVEEMLVELCSEVIGFEHIGVNDDLFDLGVHSLNATRIIARVRQTFQIELPPHLIFETPTIAALATQIGAANRGIPSARNIAIGLRPPTDPLPLAFSQERVWFVQQFDHGNRAYYFQATLHLTGWLDAVALEQSLSEILRRHEIYRTTFPTLDDRPIQVIHAAEPVRLPIVDLRAMREELRAGAVEQCLHQEFQRPFDLTQLPLIRWTLLQRGEREYTLVHVEHHLIHDGWSFNVFVRDLVALYSAFATGQPCSLPDLPIQFADFAVWQRHWMQGEEAAQQLTYWKRQLAGSPALLELPTDYPRRAVQRFQGAAHRTALPPDLCTALRVLSHQEGMTLFMVLFAGFVILLSRYTRQADLCVGTGMANRRWRETEGLLGMLINNVVLRTDVSGNPTVRGLLGQVRDLTLAAWAHQDLPFEQVVEALRPERTLSYNPLFQVMFGLHDAPMAEKELPQLTGQIELGLNNGVAKFDLSVIVVPHAARWIGASSEEGANGLVVIWEYDTDLFGELTIKQMMGHYQTLLAGMVTDPAQPVATLPLLSDAQRHQLLIAWNQTTRAYPREATIQSLFEQQAAERPEATAVVFEDQQITYRELNTRANQLAHYLRTLGVGPEVLVGVLMERSVEMVIALLGILKAGGAYVPLDPTYPKERRTFMIQDARMEVLLTRSSLAATLSTGLDGGPSSVGDPPAAVVGDSRLSPEHFRALPSPSPEGRAPRLVCLDHHWPMIAQGSPENLGGEHNRENLAYVIYTSGSTGTPKAVANSHGGILNRLFWMQDALDLKEADAVLQKTPFTFDVSVWELFWPLMTGARLVIARPEGHKDSAYLVSVIREECISTLHFVPSMLQVFVEEDGVEAGTSLSRVICSGEALSFGLQERFFSRSQASLYNLYGPTEAAVDVTCWACRQGDSSGVVPIGKPIANTQIYVTNVTPVPVGTVGEIQIGGVGVARGYLGSGELTAERFVPDPYGTAAGRRLYRTGDRARYLPDGAIDFLGRMDHQVKIRGFRVELGEIETILTQHPSVTQAVVVATRPHSTQDSMQLVAYLVSAGGESVPVRDLRHYLLMKLPEYMVPQVFMTLDSLPLTSSGKVDRKALPEAQGTRRGLEQAYVGPRTETEKLLAGIWSKLLGLEQVGVHDNFFDLGGHSLLATQVISRVRQTFAINLPLRILFERPTIAGLAESFDTMHWIAKGAGGVLQSSDDKEEAIL